VSGIIYRGTRTLIVSYKTGIPIVTIPGHPSSSSQSKFNTTCLADMELARSSASYQTYSLQPAHGGRPVHGVRFNASLLASVGFDGTVHFWSSFGEFENLAVVSCSKRPLLQVDFYNRGKAVAVASADGNVYLIDAGEAFALNGALKGHDSYVNGICNMGEFSVATSSDDYTVRIWDTREDSGSVSMIDLGREATSVAWSDEQPNQLFCGCLDNLIRCYDTRKLDAPSLTLKFHKDTVTGLSLTPDGRELLSSAMDGTLAVWDAAPFSARGDRLMHRVNHGLPANDSINDRSLLRCAWTPDGRFFSSGSGSGSEFVVCMWDRKGQPHRAFPGHAGFVTEVAFHPQEDIMASCGMDGRILVGGYRS